MALRNSFLIFPFLALAYLVAGDKIIIKKVPAGHTSAASGQEMYMAYCASCHGQDAKGNGPASPALKTAPTDLTTMAVRNNGKYPLERMAGILRGEVELTSHGSKDMPVWGPVLASVSPTGKGETTLRINNITEHIESLQVR